MGVEILGIREIRTLAFWRDCAAEVVATFILVAVQCSLPLDYDGPRQSFTQVGLGMGFVVFALAEAFGPMSGGHFNPAVSFAMLIGRRISILRACFYTVAQVLGGLAGAAFIYGVTPPQHRGQLAATTPHKDMTAVNAMVVEMWLTTNLVVVIWGATNEKRKGELYVASLAIGLTVALDIFCAGIFTGGSMNPARSLGPAVCMNIWTDHWVYWAGPYLGAIVGTLIYHALDIVKDPSPEVKNVDSMNGQLNSDFKGADELVMTSKENQGYLPGADETTVAVGENQGVRTRSSNM